MAISSDSNGDADIFWPGYVDAVTNLAINLLFVIAVMAIVLLAAILQISPLSKKDDNVDGASKRAQSETGTKKVKSDKPADPETKDVPTATTASTKEVARELLETKASLAKANQQLAQLMRQAPAQANSQATQSTVAAIDASSSSDSAAASLTRVPAPAGRIETVKATERRVQPASAQSGNNSVQNLAGGVLVVFALDVIELGDKEAQDLITKMARFSAVTTSKWSLIALSPKGFSEAVRLAYYRVHTVRNVLIKNGVPADAIDVRVTESELTGANNAHVLVRLQ